MSAAVTWQVLLTLAGVTVAGTQPLMASPLTYGLVVLLVAYYLVSGIGLVRRMRALPTG